MEEMMWDLLFRSIILLEELVRVRHLCFQDLRYLYELGPEPRKWRQIMPDLICNQNQGFKK